MCILYIVLSMVCELALLVEHQMMLFIICLSNIVLVIHNLLL